MDALAAAIQKKLQYAVSGDKYRYKDHNYDLDLTYITKNIIAMGIPGEGASVAWRNDIKMVSKFLNTNHPGRYMVFNLSGEKYDYSYFNRSVKEYGWPDHHAPPLALLYNATLSIDSFLKQHPDNVAVVHCLAGRSRTGVVVCGYLLYSKQCSDAEAAIKLFNSKRSLNENGVVLPSQIRCTAEFERVLFEGTHLIQTPTRILIKRIIITPVLPMEKQNGGLCAPVVRIESLPDLHVIKEVTSPQFWGSDAEMVINIDCVVEGDVQLFFFHNSNDLGRFTNLNTKLNGMVSGAKNVGKFPLVPLWRFSFHTSFLDGEVVQLTIDNLDNVFAGQIKPSKYIPATLTLRMEWAEVPRSKVPLSGNIQYNPPTLAVPGGASPALSNGQYTGSSLVAPRPNSASLAPKSRGSLAPTLPARPSSLSYSSAPLVPTRVNAVSSPVSVPQQPKPTPVLTPTPVTHLTPTPAFGGLSTSPVLEHQSTTAALSLETSLDGNHLRPSSENSTRFRSPSTPGPSGYHVLADVSGKPALPYRPHQTPQGPAPALPARTLTVIEPTSRPPPLPARVSPQPSPVLPPRPHSVQLPLPQPSQPSVYASNYYPPTTALPSTHISPSTSPRAQSMPYTPPPTAFVAPPSYPPGVYAPPPTTVSYQAFIPPPNVGPYNYGPPPNIPAYSALAQPSMDYSFAPSFTPTSLPPSQAPYGPVVPQLPGYPVGVPPGVDPNFAPYGPNPGPMVPPHYLL